MADTLSAAEAAARLGITRQTLYAYVSRGLLSALPGADHRESRYAREAVELLAADRSRGRKPREIAKATLDWGLPVLESRITLIEHGRLYYRGEDAVALAQTASVEAVAALLWQTAEKDAFGSTEPVVPPLYGDLGVETPLLARFALATQDEPTAEWHRAGPRMAAGCGALVRILLACMLGTAPSAAPIHRQCAGAWGLVDADAALVATALILCADHELNASSFTARCIASTGASLRMVVIGGLAALSGGRHGGVTTRLEALWRSLEGEAQPGAALRRMLDAGVDIPGFGHPLYPDGDVRAESILQHVVPRLPRAAALTEAVFDLTGRRPSLDFALVALRRCLGLPEGAAFDLFAAGRSIGWIAQALEQRTDGTMIRPRAVYVGPRPKAPAGTER